MPVRKAAPTPRLSPCIKATTLESGQLLATDSAVPSGQPSSTTTTRSTAEPIAAITGRMVAAARYAGITTAIIDQNPLLPRVSRNGAPGPGQAIPASFAGFP